MISESSYACAWIDLLRILGWFEEPKHPDRPPFSFGPLPGEPRPIEQHLDTLLAHKQAAGRLSTAVSLGERIGSSEFGWALEAPAPCKDCLNYTSIDSTGRVECSGDPSERSPGSEECLAYIPLDAVTSIQRTKEPNEVSREVTADLRRSIKRKSNAVKEYGCRVCGVPLTDENWYPTHRRRHSRICKPCHKKYGEEQRTKYRSINSVERRRLFASRL